MTGTVGFDVELPASGSFRDVNERADGDVRVACSAVSGFGSYGGVVAASRVQVSGGNADAGVEVACRICVQSLITHTHIPVAIGVTQESRVSYS